MKSLRQKFEDSKRPVTIILRGPAGVGKTSVALLLRDRLAPAVRLSVDTFRYLASPRTLKMDELRAAKLSIASDAATYNSIGFNAIIESVFYDLAVLEEVTQELSRKGGRYLVVTLRASLTCIQRRNSSRLPFDRLSRDRIRDLYKGFSWNSGLIIDTEGFSIEEVVAQIVEHLQGAEILQPTTALDGCKTCMFVRHAEHSLATEHYSKNDRSQLTVKGVAQARRLQAIVSAFSPERIITSTSRQAMDTAALMNASIQGSVVKESRLRERTFKQLEGLSYQRIAAKYSRTFLSKLLLQSDEIELPKEESLSKAQQRVVEAVRDSIASIESRVAIVSHGGPHSWLCCSLLNLPLVSLRRFPLGYAQFSLFTFDMRNRFVAIQTLNSCQLP